MMQTAVTVMGAVQSANLNLVFVVTELFNSYSVSNVKSQHTIALWGTAVVIVLSSLSLVEMETLTQEKPVTTVQQTATHQVLPAA